MKMIKTKIKQFIIGNILTLNVFISSSCLAINYIEDAKQYLQKGEYQTAIIQLKNHLKTAPDDAQARYLLGQSYLKSGNVSGAYKEFEKAYKTDKNDNKIALAYASALKLKNDKKKTREILRKSYKDNSQESKRLVILAELLLNENKLADAAELLEKAKQLDNTVEVKLGFAKLAYAEKDDSRAEQLIDSALKQDSKNQAALFMKAISLSSKKEYQKSLAILNQLYKKNPKNLRYLLERAGVKYKAKDFEGVEQDLTIILKTDNNIPQANSLMSLSKLNQKKYTEAKDYAQKVLNIIPEHYLSMYVSGVSEFALGNLNQAEKYLNQVLFQFPNNLDVKNMLANLYIAKKESDQALLILESIDKDKLVKNVNLLLSLGTAYLLTGDYEKAMLALNKANSLEPNNKVINERLVEVYLKSNDIKNAIAGLETMVVDKKNKQAQYLLVITYIQNKEFDKAREMIEQLKIQSPNDLNLYAFQAALYLINKNKTLALSAYHKAIEINKDYIPAYLGIVRIYMDEKRYKQADDLFKKILTINNKYIKAWLGRAAIAELSGNTEKVEFYIKEGLKNSKGDLKSELIALEQLAKWYIKQGRKEQVLKLGREIIQRYPKNESALFFQVKALLLNGKNQQAEAILEKLLYNYPENRKYQLLLAGLLIEKKENKRALSLLDNILKSNPDDKQSILLKGRILAANGQYKEAIETSKHYQQLFPENNTGYELEGDILFAEKKYQLALEKYQVAFKKAKTHQLLLKIVNLYLSQKNSSDAIQFLSNVIANDSDNLVARYRLALLLEKQKSYKLAIEQYQALIKRDPKNVLALNNLAWLLLEQGNAQALNYGKKAYELKPESFAILDTYGYILIKENHLEEGLKKLQKAVDLAPQANDIRYHLAEGYYLTGETQKAKDILKAILSDGFNFSEKENAKKLFNQLQ